MAVNDKDKPRTGLQATMARLSRPMYEQAPTAQQIYRDVNPQGMARTIAHQTGQAAGAVKSAAVAAGDALERGRQNWLEAARSDGSPGPFSRENPANAAFAQGMSDVKQAFQAGAAGQPLPQRPQQQQNSWGRNQVQALAESTRNAVNAVRSMPLTRTTAGGGSGLPAAASGGGGRRGPATVDYVHPDLTFESERRQALSRPTANPAATPADTQVNYGVPSLSSQAASAPNAYGIPSLARPMAQPAVQLDRTRPAPNPAGARAAVLDPRSSAGEMMRRAQMAMQSARVRSPAANTRSQMQRHYEAAGAERDFWLDQARSVGGDAQARYLAGQQARSQEGQTDATLQSQQSIAAGRDAANENLARMRDQGAMERLRELERLALSRPQQPITLADGTLAQLGPDGTMQPYTMPDGSAARGALPQSQRDYTLEANDRLFSDLLALQQGIDGTMPPDAVARAQAQMQQYRGTSAQRPPVEGAQLAPDGNWYVQRDGRWNRVDP